jgi:hypothetical protein
MNHASVVCNLQQKTEELYHMHLGGVSFMRGETSTFHLNSSAMRYVNVGSHLFEPEGREERAVLRL